MKKLVSVVLSLAMVMVLFTTTPLVAQAEENKKEIDGITYMLDAKKGVAQVVGADNSIATINILPEVDGKPVTTIGSWAFGECTSIKTVTIPDSVTEIGTRAFLGCTALADVKLGSGLTNIGALAFKDCIVLDEITIPKSVQVIGEMAFYNTAYYNNNDNWENSVLYIDDCLISARKTQTDEEYNEAVELELEGDYTIKDDTRIMADSAFLDCTSLTSITIPKSITAISEGAFCWCTSLTEFTIGDNITSIGGWSFANCQTLEKVTIGDSVTTIGENAFDGCS